MRDAWLDLLLGSCCSACGLPGRILCDRCATELPRAARVAWPTPCPAGLATPVSAGEYDGVLKELVNAHKERSQFSLVRPLGELLAQAVHGLVGTEAATLTCLVPVPSRGVVVRARGHDPMLRVTRRAAVRLRNWGVPVVVTPLLRSGGVLADQAGLSAEQRAANLAGTMVCSQRRAALLQGRWPAATYVVTDDVLTTGATAREAQRALEVRALPLLGSRRSPPR